MNEDNVAALLRAASLLIRHCNANHIAIQHGDTDLIAALDKAVEIVEVDFDPWLLDQEMED